MPNTNTHAPVSELTLPFDPSWMSCDPVVAVKAGSPVQRAKLPQREPIAMPKTSSLPPMPAPQTKAGRAENKAAAKKNPAPKPKAKAKAEQENADAKVLRLPSGRVAHGTKSGKVKHEAGCGLMRGNGTALGDTAANRAKRCCKHCCRAGGVLPKAKREAAKMLRPCRICKPTTDTNMSREAVGDSSFVATAGGSCYHHANCRCVNRLKPVGKVA